MYKKQITWLNNLSEKLTLALSKYKFVPSGFKLEYVRRYNWKTEVVYIFYEPHFPMFLTPRFTLIIPPWPFDDNNKEKPYDYFERLSQISVSMLCNQKTDFKIPTLPFFREKGIKKVISLIESNLDWFQQFDTPELCLVYLEKEYKERKQAPAYIKQKKYMEMLKSLTSLDDFKIPEAVINHDKYTKAYFGG